MYVVVKINKLQKKKSHCINFNFKKFKQKSYNTQHPLCVVTSVCFHWTILNPRSEDPPGSSSLHVSVPQTNDLQLQFVKEEGFGFVDVHCTFAK